MSRHTWTDRALAAARDEALDPAPWRRGARRAAMAERRAAAGEAEEKGWAAE